MLKGCFFSSISYLQIEGLRELTILKGIIVENGDNGSVIIDNPRGLISFDIKVLDEASFSGESG